MSETGAWDELWAAAKRADMIELAHGLGAGLKKRGSDWIGPCPIGCAREDGFVVNQEKGFLCRPSGAHGDAVDMVEHVLGCAKVDALEFITVKRPGEKDGAGYAPSAQRAGAPVRPSSKPVSIAATTTADALKLCRESVDPRGTLAERYLNIERKLDLTPDLVTVLRWHPGIGALIALFRNILTGEPQAVSRIFIDRNGKKTGRMFTGPVGGAAIMLDPFDEVLEGLHIGAGVETVMTARQWRNFKPAWALGSDGAIEKFPVLSGIEALTLIQENDGNGSSQRACRACALRWDAAGREVFIDVPKPGFKDINDVIRGKSAS